MGHTMAPDMVGQRFGDLLVTGRAGTTARRAATWHCRCLRCGGQHVTSGQRLRSGRTKSCGCAVQLVDETGKVFGWWTVEQLVGHDGHGTIWRCRCRCGTVRDVRRGNLTSGRSASCGCRYAEVARAARATAARRA